MKYLILALALSFVCSCKQTNDKNIQLVTVDVAKDYPPKEVWLQDTPKWCEPVYRNRAINNREMDPKFINTTAVPYGYGLIELNAMDLAEAYANNQITDEKLKEIASNLKEEDNPVLMILKFKN